MRASRKKKHPGKEGHRLRIPLDFEDVMKGIVQVKPWRGMKKRAEKAPKIRAPGKAKRDRS